MTTAERALLPGALAAACIAVYWYALNSLLRGLPARFRSPNRWLPY